MHGDAVGQGRAEERARRLREENAAAPAGRRQPGGAHNVDADIAFRADGRLTGVEADANADALAGGPGVLGVRALDVDSSRDGVARAGEGVKERVALRVDL